MKYLIVLGLFALIAALLYWRLRPYIQMARRLLGFINDVRRVRTGNRVSVQARQSADKSARLVRCEACGTWTPSERALRLRHPQATYCSHVCLERAAEGASSRTIRKQG